jgi:hypothetical protein
MTLTNHPRIGVVTLLCLIVALSTIQTIGITPTAVSADNELVIPLTRAPTSTEPLAASGSVSINLDNGQTKVELHHATPNAAYNILFATTSENITIQGGTFPTDPDGEGSIQGALSAGAYAGAFQVTKLGIIQYVSNNTVFSIGLNASLSATVSNSTTTQSSSQTNIIQTTSSTISSGQFVFQVQPSSNTVIAGVLAEFNIEIVQNSSSNVFLVASGVPPDSVAIFTPNVGVANPEFRSTLTIATSANTPAGTYEISIVATTGGKEFTSLVTLQVVPPVSITTAQNNATTTTPSATLSMSVNTDQSQYGPNATVTVQGHIRDNTGDAVADATIAIQVDGPTGAEVFFTNNVQTDGAGFFQTQLTLPSNAPTGTFTVFSSATKTGYSSATTRTTFVVGTSSTPSVIIKSVYAGDSAGNPSATFTVGQTIWVWVVIQNIGATFQGVVWIQVRDPSGAPVQIQIHVANLNAGETIKDGVGFTLTGNPPLGVYTVNALVSDKLISQGGNFLANADTQFALVG